MKKWLIGIGCVILVVAVAVVGVMFNLGPIVTMAVNDYGPKMTKTKLHLSGADVSLFQGQASLDDFVLGNPAGFSSPNAITVGKVTVDVDESTLTQNPVIIDKIEVIGPEITYELKGKTDNFRTIIENMKSPKAGKSMEKKGPPEETTTPSEKKEGKKVVIRDLILKDVTVKTAAAIAGGDISTTTISEIHLRNIGEESNGVEMAQALIIVLNDIYRQILSTDMLAPLKGRIEGYQKQLKGMQNDVKSLGGQIKGLMDQSAE